MISVYLVCAYFFGMIIGFGCGYVVRMTMDREPSSGLERAARTIYERFVMDEAQGYHSRDRQYVITMLQSVLPASPSASKEKS